MSKILWFEKTVEYKYVIEKCYRGQIYPFSGNLEKWFGDAINNDEGQIKIIEFKRFASNRADENAKYMRSKKEVSDYLLLKPRALKSIGFEEDAEFDGHYFVYGEINANYMTKSPSRRPRFIRDFDILHSNYWNWAINGSCNPQKMRGSIDGDLLINYLDFLFEVRSSATDKEGEEGFIEITHDGYFMLIPEREYRYLYEKTRDYHQKPDRRKLIEDNVESNSSPGM